MYRNKHTFTHEQARTNTLKHKKKPTQTHEITQLFFRQVYTILFATSLPLRSSTASPTSHKVSFFYFFFLPSIVHDFDASFPCFSFHTASFNRNSIFLVVNRFPVLGQSNLYCVLAWLQYGFFKSKSKFYFSCRTQVSSSWSKATYTARSTTTAGSTGVCSLPTRTRRNNLPVRSHLHCTQPWLQLRNSRLLL